MKTHLCVADACEGVCIGAIEWWVPSVCLALRFALPVAGVTIYQRWFEGENDMAWLICHNGCGMRKWATRILVCIRCQRIVEHTR